MKNSSLLQCWIITQLNKKLDYFNAILCSFSYIKVDIFTNWSGVTVYFAPLRYFAPLLMFVNFYWFVISKFRYFLDKPRQSTVIQQTVITFLNYVGEYKVNTNQGGKISKGGKIHCNTWFEFVGVCPIIEEIIRK